MPCIAATIHDSTMFRRKTRVAPAPADRWSVRYTRYSEWSLTKHKEEENEIELTHINSKHQQWPSEPDMQNIPLHLRLVRYFQWLSTHRSAAANQQYMSRLVEEGADVNVVYGHSQQTVLHEVAAQWDVAVAALLVEHCANVNIRDGDGRSPLHYAAYTDHTEMTEWLLDHGAELEAKTDQQQTAIHYAVRGDAVESLRLLIERGGKYDVSSNDPHKSKDSRGRTPLQLAAELDCTIVTQYLLTLEHQTPASCTVTDYSGHPALVSMILNMPKMAHEALGQLHKVYPSKRTQVYQLGLLESPNHTVKTVFEASVEQRAYQILTHTVMQKLTSVRWTKLIRGYFMIYFSVYILFLLSWSTVIVYPSIQHQYLYTFPDDAWRVGVQFIAVLLLIIQTGDEIYEFALSVAKHLRYNKWLQSQVKADLEHMNNDLFKEERQFLMKIRASSSILKISYFKDMWNYIDVVTYSLLIVTIVLHIADVVTHTEELARWTMRVAVVGVILVWVRLLKFARVSALLGPLVAIFGELRVNIFQYFVIYSVFFVPYTLSFWSLFGLSQLSSNNTNSTAAQELIFYRVPVLLFRMSLIDDYPYNELRDIDELMATILVISFLLITAVIGLNLFIALLSDTFQRVYDNAQANAELQRARLLLLLQDKIPRCFQRKFQHHLQTACSPLAEYYDDDDDNNLYKREASLLKISHQIYQALQQWREESEGQQELKETVTALSAQMQSVSAQLDEVKTLLHDHIRQ